MRQSFAAACLISGVLALTGCGSYSADRHADLVAGYDAAIAAPQPVPNVPDPPPMSKDDATAHSVGLDALIRAWEKAHQAEPPPPDGFADTTDPDFVAGIGAQGEFAGEDASMEAALADQVDAGLLIAIAHERNPGLHTARERVRVALARYPQAAALDDVLRQYNAFTKQLDTRVGPSGHKAMIDMSFPFPGALSLKGAIIGDDVAIARQDVSIAERDVATAVRLAFADYVHVDQSLSITTQSQELLKQMVAIAQTKFRVGLGKYHSVVMAQLELARIADSILTLEEKRTTIVAAINRLLDRRVDLSLGRPADVADVAYVQDFGELGSLSLERRQELSKQRTMIDRMGRMVELARLMTVPDPSQGASLLQDRMMLGSGTDMGMPAFRTQPPINEDQASWFSPRDAYIREMELGIDALDQELRESENRTRLSVHLHYTKVETAKRSIALHVNTLLPQARQALDAAGTAYQAAQIDFLSFIDAQRTRLGLQLAEQRARRDYRRHAAQLEQAVGVRLETSPLTLSRVNPDGAE